MNCLIANESIAAAEAAIRRLEARYEADPTLFDDEMAGPARPERVAGAFALLRTLITSGPDLEEVHWETDGPNAGSIYEDRAEGYRSHLIGRIPLGPNILGKMRSLFLEEVEELENQEAACRRLCHAIDRHQAVKG